MAIIFDRVNKIIEVEAPATEVTIQQLIDTIRDWEDEQENMDVAQVAKASGKEGLGGGLAVGITLELLNDWQLKFEDRLGPDYVQCTVHQGNLVGGIAGNPIKESNYTQVKVILSAAGTISAPEAEWSQNEKDNLLNLIDGVKDEVWANSDRRLTSRDIVSPEPGESLPSEKQLVDHHTEIGDILSAMKGLGFESEEDALRVIRELVESAPPPTPKATFKV